MRAEVFVKCENCQVEHVGRYRCDGCGELVCLSCYLDHNGELPEEERPIRLRPTQEVRG